MEKRNEGNTLGFWRPRNRKSLVQFDSSLVRSASVHQQVDKRLLSSARREGWSTMIGKGGSSEKGRSKKSKKSKKSKG